MASEAMNEGQITLTREEAIIVMRHIQRGITEMHRHRGTRWATDCLIDAAQIMEKAKLRTANTKMGKQ